MNPQGSVDSKSEGARGQASFVAEASLTPVMAQYWRAKKEEPDAVLFFRLGDFYELFHDDAKLVSRELGLTLTSRDKGPNAVPMAGVPARNLEPYLMKLVRRGHKVAICEQTTDPKASKGLVERAIVRVVTAGTITEEDALDARAHNFLAALLVLDARASRTPRAALAWVDLSTGVFQGAVLPLAAVRDELARLQPAEIVWSPESAARAPEIARELAAAGTRTTERESWRFDLVSMRRVLEKHFKTATLEGFGLENDSALVSPAGALIEYLQETQKSACEHVRRLELVDHSEHVVLDRATRSCLELVKTQREARREGTLLDTLDATLTPMGGRLLRDWVLAPLRRPEAILHRQRGVAELVGSPFLREEVRECLTGVQDVERLVAKLSTGRANARDLVGLASSLEAVPRLRAKLEHVYSKVLGELLDSLDPLDDVFGRIRATLVEAPPLTLREGGLIRPGFSKELDELLQIAGDGKSWMTRFQADEITRTGMQNLKVGFNSVFGYFIEVPRGQIDRVPEHYIRKQTVKNAERYITPELKEFEGKVLKSEELARELEYKLFCELRDELARHTNRILDTAAALAHVDTLAALAQRAAEYRYTAPTIDEGDVIEILDGRHPVIERQPGLATFVPNDSRLDHDGKRITILTGPNMAGKSTYIRQTALIVLLAQIGSFVPARESKIGVVDRIFTRVGAADDIARGESTFMVEMVEVANILNNATSRSLIVLDEVGRGTSTFDGLALAWAIVEFLHEHVGARSLFATHYHQLTELATRLEGVCNRNVLVREYQDEIVFLHKIVDGGTDRSYGIHVARLAGVPSGLIERAKAILVDLEADAEDLSQRIQSHAHKAGSNSTVQQLSLFGRRESAVEQELARIDPDQLTPLQALVELRRLRDLL
ncbi:MAG: DNA mismatch repair protein MutS [Planctomycetes bacterium]|nr:DNA mismatch repair protein MutS [Planctomycetota bacterium]